MRSQSVLAALCLTSLLLSACDKDRSMLPQPQVEAAVVETGTTPMPAANPSVPAAATVLSPANETPKADAKAGRTNTTMTRTEESSAMPIAGQNNDHSAPTAPARPASSP